MAVTKLNDDILTEIIPFLCIRDALALGATCSFLRRPAVRHAVRDVTFDSAAAVTKFSAFMLSKPNERIPHFRRLSVKSGIVNNSLLFLAALSPLAELVFQASKLEHLSLHCAELLLSMEPLFPHAIARHPQLTSLELSTTGENAQGVLLKMRCAPNLRHLALLERTYLPQDVPSGKIDLPPLPRLETLTLDGTKALPPRATLRMLAPALHELRLNDIKFRDSDPASGAWWPDSLTHLRGDIPSLVSLRIHRPVRSLHVDVTLENERAWDPAPLYDILQRASPVELTIGMQTSLKQAFWQTYASVLPRLRCLKLVVEDGHVDHQEIANWLENMSKPGPTSLHAVRVYVHGPSREVADLGYEPVLRAMSHSLQALRLFGFTTSSEPCPENINDSRFAWWTADLSNKEGSPNSPEGAPAETRREEWRTLSAEQAGRVFAEEAKDLSASSQRTE
ncbi:hypothetical protein GY45DRAFT_1437775 [Cubamyces sp. BRFM 1775]|nr:hypothetical protein GY45DRAFT_1437775 [Cubamyces sp. BRFM 1775]